MKRQRMDGSYGSGGPVGGYPQQQGYNAGPAANYGGAARPPMQPRPQQQAYGGGYGGGYGDPNAGMSGHMAPAGGNYNAPAGPAPPPGGMPMQQQGYGQPPPPAGPPAMGPAMQQGYDPYQPQQPAPMAPGPRPGMSGPMQPPMAPPSMPAQQQDYGGDMPFPAVKLRGLPFDVEPIAIARFLEMDPVDVVLTRRNGRFSGEAFAVLQMPMQVDMALTKNRQYLGHRWVEVYAAKKEEYYRAVVNHMNEPQEAPSQGGQGHHGGGQGGGRGQGQYGGGGGGGGGGSGGFGRGRGGGPAGAAPGHHGGGVKAEGQANGPPNPLAMHTGWLKLRGLPFSASANEIVEWFNEDSGIQQAIDASCVQLVSSAAGRPTGTAFVKFASPHDSMQAMSKDRQHFGARYVELFPSNEDEASAAAAGQTTAY